MTVFTRSTLALAVGGALVLGNISAAVAVDTYDGDPEPSLVSLREAAEAKGMVIGTAVTGGDVSDDANPFFIDPVYRTIIANEFSSVTPENGLKWDYLRPDRDTFNFEQTDKLVAFAEANGQQVRGHTLVWHSQNAQWLIDLEPTLSDAELKEILETHVKTVVGHYKGVIDQWDVANEIFDDNAQLRTDSNPWLKRFGPSIIADALRWAREADPNTLLFLNDYNVDGINAKSDAYYDLIKQLIDDGAPIDGFGIQGHLATQYGFDTSVRDNLARFDALGLQTAFTEVDVRIKTDGAEPTADQLAEQADFYGQELAACVETPGCKSFTIWGFDDGHSWVPGVFAGEGYANVLTDAYASKPAYLRMLEELGVDTTIARYSPEVIFSQATVEQGAAILATGTGFVPGSEVTAILYSDPITIGTEQADDNGRVSFMLSIPEDFAPGEHTVVLESGPLSASAIVTVTEREADTPAPQPGQDTPAAPSDDAAKPSTDATKPTAVKGGKGEGKLASTGATTNAVLLSALAVAALGGMALTRRRSA